MKLETLKATLETTISSELHKVECQIAMLTLGRSVYELRKGQRNQYRKLVEVRDYMDCDLQTIKNWSVDTFRFYLLQNDRGLYNWLGWKHAN